MNEPFIPSDVTFINTRFDPDVTPFHGIAEQMAAAFGYTAVLSIDDQLAQLVRLRVAHLTPCSYCLILHTRSALEKGVLPEKVAHLASWRESLMFTDPEKAALEYCEALTNYDLAGFPETHRQLACHFDERQIAELAAVVINMNLWTRLKLAQGATPRSSSSGSEERSG
ncbi:carboxymuconolactone decarboxylase family protein [Diaminobutyricibacter tongyongensis]|uniref:Carboxymuconolactone decarboxylase family protein n=1 Tax=Leifsonia tongyongensis TaxID=1268043 RepID=A0A6L9Y2A0_9MICO|nr:carboxymuconolactone decarboxylase family protein [Diaminobutyricibacter tongyongensis]NEN07800.1 carboxymuconolactone decarboxylase family protein [Diaminobutyricibacter tongyongensis]